MKIVEGKTIFDLVYWNRYVPRFGFVKGRVKSKSHPQSSSSSSQTNGTININGNGITRQSESKSVTTSVSTSSSFGQALTIVNTTGNHHPTANGSGKHF